MNIPKILVLLGVCTALSFGFSIHIDTGKKKKKKEEEPPPPPPPSWAIDQRSCDGPVCCDLHIDGVTSDYNLRCNGPTQDVVADIRTGGGHYAEHLREGNGRFRYTMDRDARVDLKVRGAAPKYRKHMCDNGVCCDLEQEMGSRNYDFRCDRRYDRATIIVDVGNRTERFDLNNRGRLPIELHPNDRVNLLIGNPPPPPPPPQSGRQRR